MNQNKSFNSPSDFYKNIRPEYFSDSETIYKIELPKELLAYEIETISTNQKQDQFEVLARRLAELYIAPNLIPQVGPTGGGDGKTDSETYPVSESVSERWFTPENGWSKDENWAFAISSKKEWKGKLKLDIKSIVSTNRGYTRIYFITNQKISSKKKKDAQEEFIKEFEIDIIIIDGEWIIEKIINNKLIDLAVDSLNLSDVYKTKEYIQGENDSYRKERIVELENKIITPNRYFEIDYQLIEDCLESAVLSRELEETREIIEGKFSRALRFAKKFKNENQLCRIYYEQAWTALFWLNDFEEFVNGFKNFRENIDFQSNINLIKLYSTLFTILNTHNEITELIDKENERIIFYETLKQKIDNTKNSTSSLEAETYLYLNQIFEFKKEDKECEDLFSQLNKIIIQTKAHLSYPFETVYKTIQILGESFPKSSEYDYLIDECARINAKRNSELASSKTYLSRAIQKFGAGLYQDAIIFLGKSIVKLSKEESERQLILSLRLLANSYRNIGLLWASNNCLLFAGAMSFKTWFKEGYLDRKTYDIAVELAKNEILIGRVPSLLSVCELINVLLLQIEINPEKEIENSLGFIDISLANRFLNSSDYKEFEVIPDILKSIDLEFASDSLLYRLGYIEEVIASVDNDKFNETDLDEFISNIASQPIKEQFLYETNFLNGDEILFHSNILGTNTELKFKKDKELFIISETFLAFLEGFLSTSLEEVFPTTEKIKINLIENNNIELLNLLPQELSNEFIIEINKINFFNQKYIDNLQKALLSFLAHLIQNNFVVRDITFFLDNLFRKEEVYERVSIVFNHSNFSRDFYGANPKIFLSDWYASEKHKTYSDTRNDPMKLILKDSKNKENKKTSNSEYFKNTPHNKRGVSSLIDVNLWDDAKWKAFGFFSRSNSELGIALAFENFEYAKKIFDGWINKLGKIDKEEEIRISIIKGIDNKNPFWYRVHISKEMKEMKNSDLYYSTSRFHTLQPYNSINLDRLLELYKLNGKFKIYPAGFESNGQFIPDLTRGIEKTNLIVKDAWEISLNDIDSVTILEDDRIIIPNNITNAPVLEVLKRKKEV